MALHRSLPALALIVLLAGAPVADAEKKKKPKPLTAAVNGTFTIRDTDENGFGNDRGPKWQQVKVIVKNSKLTFGKNNKASAGGAVSATVIYEAFAKTEDRSWHAGCDSEERTAIGVWSGKMEIGIKQTNWRINQGKSVKFRGWSLYTRLPDAGIDVKTGGYYQDWESILMETCLTYGLGNDTLLGSWNPGFAQPVASGRLSDDARSVKLSWVDAEMGQTTTASGSLSFSGPVDRGGGSTPQPPTAPLN